MMGTGMYRIERRYKEDARFAAMVNTMMALYMDMHLEPGEFRDAAVLAVHLAEVRTLHTITVKR